VRSSRFAARLEGGYRFVIPAAYNAIGMTPYADDRTALGDQLTASFQGQSRLRTSCWQRQPCRRGTLNDTVNAVFAPRSYVTKQYLILQSAGLNGTTFSGLTNTNLPPNFIAFLSYTANDAIQAQNFRTPTYSETDLSGGGFGLSYAGNPGQAGGRSGGGGVGDAR
jgi:hypothetical protein